MSHIFVIQNISSGEVITWDAATSSVTTHGNITSASKSGNYHELAGAYMSLAIGINTCTISLFMCTTFFFHSILANSYVYTLMF